MSAFQETNKDIKNKLALPENVAIASKCLDFKKMRYQERVQISRKVEISRDVHISRTSRDFKKPPTFQETVQRQDNGDIQFCIPRLHLRSPFF